MIEFLKVLSFSKILCIIAVLNHTEVGDRPPSIRWRIFYVYHSTHDKRITACTPVLICNGERKPH